MVRQKIAWRPVLAAGLVSGLLQVLAGVAMYLSGVYFAAWSALVNLLLLAVCIAGGTTWYVRRVLGGRSSYLRALLVGIVITLCTGLMYATYNIVSISFVYPHFLEDMVQAAFEQRLSSGLEHSLAPQVLESLRAQTTIGAVIANNLRAFLLFGMILSALTALAFRNAGARGV
jgi:hypothetical protein